MTHPVFDKTEKGREEIATRKYHLALRLRTLLLLIDGKHTIEDLLGKVGGLGLTEDSVVELLNDGFIQPIFTPGAPPAPQQPSTPLPAAAPPTPHAGHTMPNGESQFQAIYHFYTETIKSTIGLRGYGLQLKVEKASSIEDFRALRQPYLEAVLKAKGGEIAKAMKMRLDEVLYVDEPIPPLMAIPGL
jgi:hypothetical protein